MQKFIPASWLVACALILPGLAPAQNNSIETPANLKDTTTHVVVERKVIETTKTYQQATPREVQRKIAIVVQNRASAGLNDKVAVLEDLVASQVAGKGFAVISRDDVTRSLKNYSDGQAPQGELTKLDRSLEDNTSALRLAQNLGADYILVPSIGSLGTEKNTYNGNGISTLNTTYHLRVTYKIVEAALGGAVRGGSFKAEKTLRQTGSVQTESSDVINELLEDAAEQLTAAIVKTAKTLPAEVAQAGLVNFQVTCSMTDPRHLPVVVSAIGITEDQHLVITNQPIAVQALDVTVELDGVAVGSAPGSFSSRPGLHKIRLSREGFSPWERTINIYEGENLRVALQLSEAGFARWADTTAFLAGLDTSRKLSDAQVKQIEGMAEFLKNSHYRVDTQENLKLYKSIY